MNRAQFVEATRPEAEVKGFATYCGYKHLMVDIPDEGYTITVKTPDGNKVSFAFMHRPEGIGHQCVDIIHESGILNESGNHLQRAAFLGQGPTVATTKPDDETPTTVVVLQLPK